MSDSVERAIQIVCLILALVALVSCLLMTGIVDAGAVPPDPTRRPPHPTHAPTPTDFPFTLVEFTFLPIIEKGQSVLPEQCRLIAKMQPWYREYIVDACCDQYGMLCHEQ